MKKAERRISNTAGEFAVGPNVSPPCCGRMEGAYGSNKNCFQGVVGTKPVGSEFKRKEKRGLTQLDK